MGKCAGKLLKKLLLLPDVRRLKRIKFDFGWGSAPDPDGELTALLSQTSSWI